MVTIHAKCLDYHKDIGGYTLYVFQNLEPRDWSSKYIMCVRVPNWEHELFKLNDQGFLTYEEIHAGVDQWYNKEFDKMVPYNYTFIQFIRFITEPKDENKEIFI